MFLFVANCLAWTPDFGVYVHALDYTHAWHGLWSTNSYGHGDKTKLKIMGHGDMTSI